MYFRTNLVGTLSRLRETADHLDNGEPDGEHENRDREPADPLREPDHHVGLMARCLGEPVDALVESFGAATLKLGNRGVPFVGRALGTCMVYEFVIFQVADLIATSLRPATAGFVCCHRADSGGVGVSSPLNPGPGIKGDRGMEYLRTKLQLVTA